MINQEEYEVLKALDSRAKSIVRQARGWLWVAEQPIMKDETGWYVEDGFDAVLEDDNLFQFIQWEDEGPYEIAELIREYEIKELRLAPSGTVIVDSFSRAAEAIGDKLEGEEVKDKEWLKKQLFYEEKFGMFPNEIESLHELINQLDEPEKVVVPQFVADWWERDGDSVTVYGGLRIDKRHKFDLVSNFHDRGLGDHLWKVEEWIDENNSTFLDLVNGKPYEVEKEKLYYVLDSKDIPLLERENDYRTCKTTTALSIYETYIDKSQFALTEQEIKDYDERFWAFAVPVEEVEENV